MTPDHRLIVIKALRFAQDRLKDDAIRYRHGGTAPYFETAKRFEYEAELLGEAIEEIANP